MKRLSSPIISESKYRGPGLKVVTADGDCVGKVDQWACFHSDPDVVPFDPEVVVAAYKAGALFWKNCTLDELGNWHEQ